jgi:hypothetical protein
MFSQARTVMLECLCTDLLPVDWFTRGDFAQSKEIFVGMRSWNTGRRPLMTPCF